MRIILTVILFLSFCVSIFATPTSTVTKTVVQSKTNTPVVSATPTITKTITQTVTMSITNTSTPVVAIKGTKTATPTVTPTIVYINPIAIEKEFYLRQGIHIFTDPKPVFSPIPKLTPVIVTKEEIKEEMIKATQTAVIIKEKATATKSTIEAIKK